MAKTKTSDGEMNIPINMGGKEGTATLRIIPENDEAGEPAKTHKGPAEKADAEPPPDAEPPAKPDKPVRLLIQVEFGAFEERFETLQDARTRAEEIVDLGAWQKVGNQWILHAPATIHRIVVTE